MSDPSILVTESLVRGGPQPSTAGRTGRRLRPLIVLALLWLLLLLVVAVAPGLFTDGDPLLSVAAPRQPPSWGHPFGTDEIGRDLYTRVLYGARFSLGTAFIAVAVGLIVGGLIGLICGYAGGWVDTIGMRLIDVLLAIPGILLSLAIVLALGFGAVNVAVAVGLMSVAGIARIMRAEVLRVSQSIYIEAARAGGAHPLRVLTRHVLPNAGRPVLSLLALEFSTAILAISALSFLGFGAPPPAPEWGALVASGRSFVSSAWWLTSLPGAVIALTVLAAGQISRAIGDRGAGR